MIFRYSLNPQEISISGTKIELMNLSRLFLQGDNLIKGEKNADPHPYKELSEYLEIRNLEKSLVSFKVLSGKILAQGDLQKLLIVSENILDLLEHSTYENHIHMEYFEDHPYLSEESIPVIISCIEPI